MAGRKQAGHLRYKDGAWRLTVEGPPTRDPRTGKRRRNQVHRTVHAPNTRDGAKEAERVLRRLVDQVEDDARRGRPTVELTFRGLTAEWMAHREKQWEERSPGQPAATMSRVRRRVFPHIGDLAAAAVSPADLNDMYRAWRDDGLAESTIGRLHDIVHSVFEYALRSGRRLDFNPADRVELTGRKRRKHRRNTPTDEACQAILDAAELAMLAYVRLNVITGARRGSLVALPWANLGLDQAEVLFDRALAKVPGGFEVKGTKADVDYRVALDPKTVEILREHRRRCEAGAAAAGVALRPDAYVFARSETPDGRLPWHPDGANQRFDRVRRKAGKKVPEAAGVTPHQFRHWLATVMFNEGFSAVLVAGRGGWASATLPHEVYGHHRPVSAEDRAAAAALAARLDGAR